MVTITEYKGIRYQINKARIYEHKKIYRDDYIRIEYPTGFVDMKMSAWEKLPQKTKNKFLKSIAEK